MIFEKFKPLYKSLSSRFSPPQIENSEVGRVAAVLNSIILISLAIAIVYLFYFGLSYGFELRFFLMLLVIPFLIFIRLLLYRQKVRLVGWLFSMGLFGFVVFLTMITGGVSSSITIGYLTIILLAGVVLGIKESLLFTILSILAGLLVALLQETYGLNFILPYSPLSRWIHLNGFLILSALLVIITIRTRNQALQQMQVELDDRKKAEAVLERHARYLETLHEIAISLLDRRDPDQLLHLIVERAGELVGTPHGYLDLVLPDGSALAQKVGTGVFASSNGETFAIGEGVSGQVFLSGESMCVDDYSNWEHRTFTDVSQQFKAVMGVPLYLGDSVVGVIGLAYVEEGRSFVKAQSGLVSRLAALASLALENAGLVQALNTELAERERAEELLRQANESLEQRVRERTAELEAFTYSVSHDLRAPLRGIDGYSRLLLDEYSGRLDGQAQFYLDQVRQATQNMGRLIDDLLQLSRINRAALTVEKVDLSSLAESILFNLRRQFPRRQVRWEIQPDVIGAGDHRLLGLVLENLLENAYKFTQNRPEARIEFGQQEMPDGTAYFVRDNGIGFNMIYADKLFQAFSRLHDQVEYPGTGVGLAIVWRIIQRHGGKVWAESQVGEGATFYFSLPLSPVANPDESVNNHLTRRP